MKCQAIVCLGKIRKKNILKCYLLVFQCSVEKVKWMDTLFGESTLSKLFNSLLKKGLP